MNKLFAGSLGVVFITFSGACTVNNDGTPAPAASGSSTSTTTPPSTTPDASTTPTTDGSLPTTPGNLLACTSAVPTGAKVTIQRLPTQTAPVPAGGSFADGTYQLTAMKGYGPSLTYVGTLVARETLEVANGQWRIAYHYDDAETATTLDGAHAGTFTPVDSTLGGDETCEWGQGSDGLGGFSRPYSASGSTIDIFEDSTKSIVFTYTKQ